MMKSKQMENNSCEYSAKSPLVIDEKNGYIYRMFSRQNQNGTVGYPQVLQLVNNKWRQLNETGLPQSGWLFPVLQTDQNGAPCLSNTGVYPFHAKPVIYIYTANAWTSLAVDELSNASLSFCKFAFDALNTPYLLYSLTTDSTRLSLKKYNGSHWVTIGSPRFSDKLVPGPVADLVFDNASNPWVIFNTTTGKANMTKVMTYTNSNWTSVGSVNSHSNNPDISLKAGTNGSVYCYYTAVNNIHTIASCSGGSITPLITHSNIHRSKMGFLLDNLNQIIAYRAEFPSLYPPKLGQYYYYINGAWTDISPGVYCDINAPFVPTADNQGNFYLHYFESNDQYFTSTFIKYDPVKKWTVLGDGEAGIINSRTYSSVVKTDTHGTMYLCYSDLADSGKVSVMRYVNNTWSYLGQRGISETESWVWYFTLDREGTPYLMYRNIINSSQLGDVIIRKFNGSDWQQLGTRKIYDGWSNNYYPKLQFDKNNRPFFIYQDNDREFLYYYRNKEWEALTDSRGRHVTLGRYNGNTYRKLLVDTNNTILAIESLSQLTVIKDSAVTYLDIPVENGAYASQLLDFKLNPYNNLPYLFYIESKGNVSTVKVNRLYQNKWEQVGNADFPFMNKTGNSYLVFNERFCNPQLGFDPVGNPFILCAINSDTNKVALYMLKNNYWQKAGGINVSNIPALTYNFDFSDNKIHCLLTNKGAWLRTIQLPALIAVKNFKLDTCNAGETTLKVNVTNAAGYQWQVDEGIGFGQVSDGGIYTGARSGELSINTRLITLSQYNYRCIVSTRCGWSDTSNFINLSCRYNDSIIRIPQDVLFPNPSSGIFTIDIKAPIRNAAVLDAMGRKLRTYTCGGSCPGRMSFDLTDQPEGIYVVVVQSERDTWTYRYLKKSGEN